MRSQLFLALVTGLLMIASAQQSLLAGESEEAQNEDARVEEVGVEDDRSEDRNDDDSKRAEEDEGEDREQPADRDAMKADDDDDDRPAEGAESMEANDDEDGNVQRSDDRPEESNEMAEREEHGDCDEENEQSDIQAALSEHHTLFDTNGKTVRDAVNTLAEAMKFDVVYSSRVSSEVLDSQAKNLLIVHEPVSAQFILSFVLKNAGLTWSPGESGKFIVIDSPGSGEIGPMTTHFRFYNCERILQTMIRFKAVNNSQGRNEIEIDDEWKELLQLIDGRLQSSEMSESNGLRLGVLGPLLVVNGSEKTHEIVAEMLQQIEEALGQRSDAESSARQASSTAPATMSDLTTGD